jgi:hypothetical protein
MGVTRKFAQIFFREDKDLTGKRGKDPKNAYVTGIFGGRYFLKFFVALEVLHPISASKFRATPTRWIK